MPLAPTVYTYIVGPRLSVLGCVQGKRHDLIPGHLMDLTVRLWNPDGTARVMRSNLPFLL